MAPALLRHRGMLSVLVGALCGVGPAVSAEADPQIVDLQLILAVDISTSMSSMSKTSSERDMWMRYAIQP